MSLRGLILTFGAAFAVWVWVEFLTRAYQLCKMVCAVGAHGW